MNLIWAYIIIYEQHIRERIKIKRRYKKHKYIKARTLSEAIHILQTGATIRETAEFFKISKSTVHKDISVRLKEIDGAIYKKVCEVLESNFNNKHIRGGHTTRLKYKKI